MAGIWYMFLVAFGTMHTAENPKRSILSHIPPSSSNNTKSVVSQKNMPEHQQKSDVKTTIKNLPEPPPLNTKALNKTPKSPDNNTQASLIKKTKPPSSSILDKNGSKEKQIKSETDKNKQTEDPKITTQESKTSPQKDLHVTDDSKPSKDKEPVVNEHSELYKKLKKQEVDERVIRFNFEEATLENVAQYVEKVYNIKFLPDDAIIPMIKGGGALGGHKVSFKTNKPLSRERAWDLFLIFLDLANLTLTPTPNKNLYRITSTILANQEPLPVFFNTDPEKLPNNRKKIRYVFFVENIPINTAQGVSGALASKTAKINILSDLNALIITDKAINIKSLMKIIKELDKEMPEAMSVLKLKRADAQDVEKLYSDLTKAEQPQGVARFFQQRKQPESQYFPANARVIAEPRTNALILIGPKSALKNIEEFIIKHVDTELNVPYSPLHVYELQYTNAENIASIINQVVKFGQGTPASAYGGVRDGDQYFKQVSVTSESAGNRLIIKADNHDYEKIQKIIKNLDVPQPQVAIEVLVINVDITDNKTLGMQIRNKAEGKPMSGVNFQNSGLPLAGGVQGIVDGPSGSLLGNLISIAKGSLHEAGTTLLSLGKGTDVWGLLKMVQTFAQTSIISNPFLVATNKYTSSVQLGATRRIKTGTVQGSTPQDLYGDKEGHLKLSITPQINTDGIIQMEISIEADDFSNTSNIADGNTFSKKISTLASVADQEILVLGGSVRNKVTQTIKKVPFLGSIPILGWLFKNKTKVYTKSNILYFISPRIIKGDMSQQEEYSYTQAKMALSKQLLGSPYMRSETRDPITNSWFKNEKNYGLAQIAEFMQENETKKSKTHKKRDKQKRKPILRKSKRTSTSRKDRS